MNPARWWRPGGDTGSMAMAMMLTLVAMSLTAMLLPVVLAQIAATRSTVERSRALHAAQAGLDVALAQIRAANDGNGTGRLSDLPCGEITGSLGTGSVARYQVTVRYYREDPHGKSEEWLRDNTISCVVGGGTYVTPAFALLTAAGTDEASGAFAEVSTRDLRGTYTFQTTNQNIAGGLIHVFKTATSRDLCLDAGSGSPAAGANVTMQVCAAGSAQQKFAYNTDLTLSLVSSATGANPKGMCLMADAPQVVGRIVKFQPCETSPPPGQRWSFNDNANFEGTNDGVGLNNLCFNVQTRDTPGSLVVLGSTGSGTCKRSAYDNLQTFSPDAAVGAGAAGPVNSQLVNFKQFGRCLDVTNTDVRSTFLIAWPCKQAPDPVNVTWNQKWALPALGGNGTGTGRITTTRSGVVYCLQSPRDPGIGKYVVIVTCPNGVTPDELTWTVAGATGSYATSYRIMDKAGYCLEPREDPSNPDYFASGQMISKIYVAPCTSSTLQKWNAPPNIEAATPIKDINEK